MFGTLHINAEKVSLMNKSKWWLAISSLVILAGIVSMFVQGLNVGIDFAGGTALDMTFQNAVTTSQVKQVLQKYNLGDSQVVLVNTQAHQGKEVSIRMVKYPDQAQQKSLFADLKQLGGDYKINSLSGFSPTISKELQRNEFIAFGIAVVLMIVYITIRFEWMFAVAAILALLHDGLITVGIFSILQQPVDSAFVAAILTILGYSINDTIIIFDRIRENLRRRRQGETMVQLVDVSIGQTLVRSLSTSGTTLVAVLALLLLGGHSIFAFSLALFVGIVSGTYSSIFIASPIWLMLHGEPVLTDRGVPKAS